MRFGAAPCARPTWACSSVARYAEFFFAVNVLTVLLQALVVSRVVKYGGLGVGLLVLPVISFMNGMAVFVVPMLAVLQIGKTLENATDYSLNNTVRQMLWLPTSRDMKFKAKQAIDTFFVRLGDVSSALLVLRRRRATRLVGARLRARERAPCRSLDFFRVAHPARRQAARAAAQRFG